MEKLSKETIQTMYEWYLKHKEMWSKIVELLERGEKGEIDFYEKLKITPCSKYSLTSSIKSLVLKELHKEYYSDCAACNCLMKKLNKEECTNFGCILKWNDSIKNNPFGYECEEYLYSPYKDMLDILGVFTGRLFVGYKDPFPCGSLRICAERVRDLPFTYQEEYDALMKGDE